MLRVLIVRIYDLYSFEKIPHCVIYLVPELGSATDVVLIPGSQVAQHRIVLRGKRHEVSGICRHNLVLAPVKIIEADRHMQRRTDIEAEGYALQFSHNDIFQTAPYQLFTSLKDFRSDKPDDRIFARHDHVTQHRLLSAIPEHIAFYGGDGRFGQVIQAFLFP